METEILSLCEVQVVGYKYVGVVHRAKHKQKIRSMSLQNNDFDAQA